jgi:hypothetical protein
MSRRLPCFAAVILGFALVPSWALAQTGKAVGGIKGSIKTIDANTGVITIADPNGKLSFVKMKQGGAFSLEGTAEPAFLAAGHVVDFNAKADRKGNIEGEIKEMRITELTGSLEPSFYSEERPAASDPPEKTYKYFIRGTVKANKDGDLQIQANNVVVKGKLAADAKISFSLTDYRLAQTGDELEVMKGVEGAPGYILGENVNIKCLQPVAPKKKGPIKRPGAK